MPATTIAIPTYGRDDVLTDTIASLVALESPADEVLIIDQTPVHKPHTESKLQHWNESGVIRLVQLKTPSITQAMNQALMITKSDFVLFLDDDIRPRAELIRIHVNAHISNPSLWATVGQVIQPWQEPQDIDASRKATGLRKDEDFPFHSTRDRDIENVMAGNLCVHRERALSIGGFDENFVGAAYRFETEFARRIIKAGGKIRFLGGAGIDHLRAERGGTRSTGSHMTSADPKHGIGDHYYAMLHAESPSEARAYCMRRILREVRTKFHLTHPWWIPVKLLGELRAYFGARRLYMKKLQSDNVS